MKKTARIREAGRTKTDLSVHLGSAKVHSNKPASNPQENRKLGTTEIQKKLTQVTKEVRAEQERWKEERASIPPPPPPFFSGGNGPKKNQDDGSRYHLVSRKVQRLAARRVSLWRQSPASTCNGSHMQRRELFNMFQVCTVQAWSVHGRTLGKRLRWLQQVHPLCKVRGQWVR